MMQPDERNLRRAFVIVEISMPTYIIAYNYKVYLTAFPVWYCCTTIHQPEKISK